MRELRSLLFGKEKVRLQNLQQRLDDPVLQARDVSRVLPMAIAQRSKQDDQLVPALRSTVEEIFNLTVQRHPERVIQVLYPVIGPVIRKSISNALRSMLQKLQRTLDLSLSPRSIRWRLEALRTGRPFSEIVLLHTLRYRVEQIFLIHRETGLVLRHVVAEEAPSQDPDLVSAMLTAIQDFVRDSFQVSDASSLETLEFGELSVWIEQGPLAVLAAVIRGEAPLEFRETLQQALEEIHLQQRRDLEGFDGDAGAFAAVEPILGECLETELKDEEPSRGSALLLWGGLGAVLLLLGLWLWVGYRTQARWSAYLEQLQARPGIVVTRAERRGSRMSLHGLLDPAADDPTALLAAHSLTAAQLEAHWTPFLALAPEILLRRAQSELDPPPGVRLEIQDQVLHLSGSAPAEWIAQARGRRIAGISRVETVDLTAVSPEAESFLESVRLKFSEGVILEPSAASQLSSVAASLSALDEWASRSGAEVEVLMVGNTDPLGTERLNRELGRRRAERVRQALAERGVSWPHLKIETTSSTDLGAESQDRSVTLRVFLPGEAR